MLLARFFIVIHAMLGFPFFLMSRRRELCATCPKVSLGKSQDGPLPTFEEMDQKTSKMG